MAEYRISGVWKDSNKVITHYAFHTVNTTGITRAIKKSKAEAIKLVEDGNNTTVTWVWDYNSKFWKVGEKVTVVGTGSDKYLRSDPNNKSTDNLGHLIDFNWIII